MKSRISKCLNYVIAFWGGKSLLLASEQFFLLLTIVGLRDRHDQHEWLFSAHSQNVQPDDLLDGHQSRFMCIVMLRPGLAELVAWTKNIAQKG